MKVNTDCVHWIFACVPVARTVDVEVGGKVHVVNAVATVRVWHRQDQIDRRRSLGVGIRLRCPVPHRTRQLDLQEFSLSIAVVRECLRLTFRSTNFVKTHATDSCGNFVSVARREGGYIVVVWLLWVRVGSHRDEYGYFLLSAHELMVFV